MLIQNNDISRFLENIFLLLMKIVLKITFIVSWGLPFWHRVVYKQLQMENQGAYI